MEKLDLRQPSGQAKSLGTIISVCGALIVTFYKGPAVLMASLPHSGFKNHHIHSEHSAWVFGGLLLAIQCIVSSSWNIAQAATVKDYPEEMTIVFFYTLFLTIQCSVISLFVEWKNPSAWKLELGIEMVAILYAAIFVSVFRIGVHVWCLHKKGPVYVAMFKPLGIAIAVAMVVIFLGDALYLGSVIGSVVIAFGFYTVIWAQIKEKKMVPDNEVQRLESSIQRAPLLPTDVTEV
ncbi:WAT1-related protein At5g40240 [Rosa chinensis]|nr:WAT1-related protein At5g40240 [Rosa chinensis]